MDLDSTFDVPPHVIAREVGDELVILDLEGGQYFGLGEVGRRMWDVLADSKPLAVARDALLAEFDVTADVLERDLLDLATDLCAKKLLIEAG